MSLICQPGALINPILVANGVTGLVGTVKLGIEDSAGHYLAGLTPSTSGIVETDEPGVYIGTRTAPSVYGSYALVWSAIPGYPPNGEELVVASVLPDAYIAAGNQSVDTLLAAARAEIADPLGQMRLDAQLLMPETIEVHRKGAKVRDTAGGTTYAPETIVATVPARIGPLGQSQAEQEIAARIEGQEAWRVSLPALTDVKLADRLVSGSRSFEVSGLLAPRSFEAARVVVATEIT